MAQQASETETVSAQCPRRALGGLIWIGGLLLFAGGLIWLSRNAVADKLVANQLEQRDVKAGYQIVSIGPRTQRIENVIIGNPDKPDLSARRIELDIGWTWSGPAVESIRADGVRLYGRLVDGRLSLGEVDKLLPSSSREPFSLPDLAVALNDARARIDTPWGQIGASARGKGPLRDGFSGEIALIGKGLADAGCTAETITVFGNLRVTAGRPVFDGPLRGKNIRCEAQSLRLASINANLSARLTPDFTGWSGSFDALAGEGVTAAGRSARSSLSGQFEGTAARTAVNFDAKANDIESTLLTAKRFAAVGNLIFGTEPLRGQAKLSLTGTALPPARLATLQALASRGGGLVNDLLAPLARAGRLAFNNFDASADVTLNGGAGQTQVTMRGPNLRSASGAALNSGANSSITLNSDGSALRWQAGGSWTLAGGGLPMAQIRLARSPGGQIRGQLNVTPITGKASRLTLKPIRISGDRVGNWSIASEASISGSMGGARVEGLQMRFRALVDPRGNVRLADQCASLALASARAAGITLGQNRLQLCSARGQSLLAYRDGKLAGDIALIAPSIKGSSGENQLLLSAASGRYALANGKWSLDALSVGLGEGDEASIFVAKQVSGEKVGGALAGTVSEASGEISTIPLDMSGFEGKWRFEQGQFTLAGRMMLSDQQNPRRFNPLSTQDVMLRFKDGKISADASFQEQQSSADVVRAELRHDFDLASGSADLIVSALRFNRGFQPDQLTPLALGVIANADATVSGRGRIDWLGSSVTSGGTFTSTDSNFAAAFGSVRGASTTLTFDDLIRMRSLAGQRISIDEINPGFPVIGGQIYYQLLDANRIHIEGGRWPFAGGELRLKETTLDFDVSAVRRMEFELIAVDAAVFLSELGFSNINASGVFDGILPVEFSGLGGRIVNGRLTARAGGGEVAYVGELSNYNLGTMANFAFNMLKSVRYKEMEIVLNGELDGEMLTDVTFAGLSQGKGATRNFITRQVEKLPIVFNVRINAPFRQLITSAKSLYDPTQYIGEQLPQLLDAERLKKNLPVQPRESDPVQ